MKVRSGFVSNSSSSSFCLIGKAITANEIKNHDDVWMIGENCDGYEAFELTDEVKDAILEHDIDGDFYVAYFVATGKGSIPKETIKKLADEGSDFTIEVCEITEWSSYEQEGLKGFLQNYIEDYFDPTEDEE